MKKFFVLYMAKIADFQKVVAEMAKQTPEQRAKEMKEWSTWTSEHKGAVVDEGVPVGKTKRVTSTQISDVKNEIGGYSIIQANSHDEAAKTLQSHPHFKILPNGWIEVMEILPMEL